MARRTSPEADDDFAQIYLYGLQNFGRRQAEIYAIGLLDALDHLATHPRLGRERTDIRPPVRLLPHVSHNILYTVADGDVLVLRIVHASVDWVRLFDKPE